MEAVEVLSGEGFMKKQKMFAFHCRENGAVDHLGEIISEQGDLLRIQVADALTAVGIGVFDLTSEVMDFPKRECRMFLDSGECIRVANLINKRIREEIKDMMEERRKSIKAASALSQSVSNGDVKCSTN